jgi:hypothetical protein
MFLMPYGKFQRNLQTLFQLLGPLMLIFGGQLTNSNHLLPEMYGITLKCFLTTLTMKGEIFSVFLKTFSKVKFRTH